MTANPTLRGGDILVFASDCFLGDAIELWTDSVLSHSAMVIDPALPVDGQPQRELHIIESTIINGRNGPQINPLEQRLHDYQLENKGRVWGLRLSRRIRAYLDWTVLWDFAASKLHDHYNIWELGEYILRKLPLVSYIPQLYRPAPDAEVCSELVAELLRAGGLPGLKPPQMPPQALAELRIYEDAQQLLGEPITIPRFNSI
jgi:hypothetical protein